MKTSLLAITTAGVLTGSPVYAGSSSDTQALQVRANVDQVVNEVPIPTVSEDGTLVFQPMTVTPDHPLHPDHKATAPIPMSVVSSPTLVLASPPTMSDSVRNLLESHRTALLLILGGGALLGVGAFGHKKSRRSSSDSIDSDDSGFLESRISDSEKENEHEDDDNNPDTEIILDASEGVDYYVEAGICFNHNQYVQGLEHLETFVEGLSYTDHERLRTAKTLLESISLQGEDETRKQKLLKLIGTKGLGLLLAHVNLVMQCTTPDNLDANQGASDIFFDSVKIAFCFEVVGTMLSEKRYSQAIGLLGKSIQELGVLCSVLDAICLKMKIVDVLLEWRENSENTNDELISQRISQYTESIPQTYRPVPIIDQVEFGVFLAHNPPYFRIDNPVLLVLIQRLGVDELEPENGELVERD